MIKSRGMWQKTGPRQNLSPEQYWLPKLIVIHALLVTCDFELLKYELLTWYWETLSNYTAKAATYRARSKTRRRCRTAQRTSGFLLLKLNSRLNSIFTTDLSYTYILHMADCNSLTIWCKMITRPHKVISLFLVQTTGFISILNFTKNLHRSI